MFEFGDLQQSMRAVAGEYRAADVSSRGFTSQLLKQGTVIGGLAVTYSLLTSAVRNTGKAEIERAKETLAATLRVGAAKAAEIEDEAELLNLGKLDEFDARLSALTARKRNLASGIRDTQALLTNAIAGGNASAAVGHQLRLADLTASHDRVSGEISDIHAERTPLMREADRLDAKRAAHNETTLSKLIAQRDALKEMTSISRVLAGVQGVLVASGVALITSEWTKFNKANIEVNSTLSVRNQIMQAALATQVQVGASLEEMVSGTKVLRERGLLYGSTLKDNLDTLVMFRHGLGASEGDMNELVATSQSLKLSMDAVASTAANLVDRTGLSVRDVTALQTALREALVAGHTKTSDQQFDTSLRNLGALESAYQKVGGTAEEARRFIFGFTKMSEHGGTGLAFGSGGLSFVGDKQRTTALVSNIVSYLRPYRDMQMQLEQIAPQFGLTATSAQRLIDAYDHLGEAQAEVAAGTKTLTQRWQEQSVAAGDAFKQLGETLRGLAIEALQPLVAGAVALNKSIMWLREGFAGMPPWLRSITKLAIEATAALAIFAGIRGLLGLISRMREIGSVVAALGSEIAAARLAASAGGVVGTAGQAVLGRAVTTVAPSAFRGAVTTAATVAAPALAGQAVPSLARQVAAGAAGSGAGSLAGRIVEALTKHRTLFPAPAVSDAAAAAGRAVSTNVAGAGKWIANFAGSLKDGVKMLGTGFASIFKNLGGLAINVKNGAGLWSSTMALVRAGLMTAVGGGFAGIASAAPMLLAAAWPIALAYGAGKIIQLYADKVAAKNDEQTAKNLARISQSKVREGTVSGAMEAFVKRRKDGSISTNIVDAAGLARLSENLSRITSTMTKAAGKGQVSRSGVELALQDTRNALLSRRASLEAERTVGGNSLAESRRSELNTGIDLLNTAVERVEAVLKETHGTMVKQAREQRARDQQDDADERSKELRTPLAPNLLMVPRLGY